MINFTKYQASGNDFILIDDRKKTFPQEDSTWIRQICHRSYGIGADGLILLQPSTSALVKMRIFNADGYEASMCGNGLRVVAKQLYREGLKMIKYHIETHVGVLSCIISGNQIRSSLGAPCNIKLNHPLKMGDEILNIHLINTGAPHAVVFVKDLSCNSLMGIAKEIRSHSFFSPSGVNVNFATMDGPSHLKMRTFEKGVEGETLSCGTGAAAVAAIYQLLYQVNEPIDIRFVSDNVLRIDLLDEGVHVTGPAEYIFEGIIGRKL